jgi:hypothetical protein
VAHAVLASNDLPVKVLQRYPAHLLDRKNRSTPEWAYFNGLLVAIVRVEKYDEMAEVVPRSVAAVPGIARTHTLMTFQHYVSA